MREQINVAAYVNGILSGDRVVLAKAITLIESNLPSDRRAGDEILEQVLPKTGNSIRIGITGAPGAGKSTFIESFGRHIIQHHRKKVAVLTVDPTSPRTKGSILGDKTRMDELARHPMAFIRPSASGETLGGITGRTREAISLCEAAGYEVIMVETVGVGQSETAVKKVVDFFLLLMLAGAGDELQGIKKGILEMADAIVITKADGDNIRQAIKAKAEYHHAVQLLRPDESGWIPGVLTCSSLTGDGIEAVWRLVCTFEQRLKETGHFNKRRKQQQVDWMHEHFNDLVYRELARSPHLSERAAQLEQQVRSHKVLPVRAAQQLLEELIRSLKHEPK